MVRWRKGASAAQRDAALLKVVYAFGLRRREAWGLDVEDLRHNPRAPGHGRRLLLPDGARHLTEQGLTSARGAGALGASLVPWCLLYHAAADLDAGAELAAAGVAPPGEVARFPASAIAIRADS